MVLCGRSQFANRPETEYILCVNKKTVKNPQGA